LIAHLNKAVVALPIPLHRESKAHAVNCIIRTTRKGDYLHNLDKSIVGVMM